MDSILVILLKILVSIKPLVTSNGELLVIPNIVRNGSLWSKRSFRERSHLKKKWFRYLIIRFWCLEVKHLKAHNFAWQGCFSVIIISQLRRPIELKFWQVCYFICSCFCWDTPSEKTGLWQLPIVSTVFKDMVTIGNCQIPLSLLTWCISTYV